MSFVETLNRLKKNHPTKDEKGFHDFQAATELYDSVPVCVLDKGADKRASGVSGKGFQTHAGVRSRRAFFYKDATYKKGNQCMERNFLSHILLVISDQQFGQVRMLHLKEQIKLITFIYLDTFLSEKIVVKFKVNKFHRQSITSFFNIIQCKRNNVLQVELGNKTRIL